jgi:hypothetical protein
MRSVGMDLQFRSQRSHGRKRLPRLKFTAYEGLLRGKNELIEN